MSSEASPKFVSNQNSPHEKSPPPPPPRTTWQHYINTLIAREISRITRYGDRLIQWNPLPNDSGEIFDLVDCPHKQKVHDGEDFPDLSSEKETRSIVLLNGNFNHHFDIQELLLNAQGKLSRSTRMILVAYNPYLRWLYALANLLGLRSGKQLLTFLTHTDLNNLVKLSGYEVVRIRPAVYFPFKLLGLGSLLNKVLPSLPLLNALGYAMILVLRPIVKTLKKPSLSIVIPSRNERGNIENALKRMPVLEGSALEIIFVEGHSTDNTWEEIQRVMTKYEQQFQIKAFQQTGKGKNDAVRLGFSQASGELLTILDADLTMPPELLNRFYDAYCQGLGDFINGNRLVYPMEGEAMRFLNHLGNVFFAKALSYVLDAKLGDSLCGTKLLSRVDYERIVSWRNDFGDFDPFGDFELLFPAAILGLGIVDVPIRYRDRTYGSTNISRFQHGWMLLKMTLIGLFRIKMGHVK